MKATQACVLVYRLGANSHKGKMYDTSDRILNAVAAALYSSSDKIGSRVI